MNEIRTRDEALAAVDRGLAQWEANVTGVVTQAGAVVETACREADDAVRRWMTKIATLQARLASLGANDDPRSVESELHRAEVSLQSARSARERVERVANRVAVLGRSVTQRTSAQVAAARADLARRTNDLESYRAGWSAAAGGAAPATSIGGNSSGALAALGLTEVDVSAADFADNPIIGGFGREGMSRADYRWAVQTWDEVVRPGVARGETRADFEARDFSRDAPVLRRTAAVYDMFLGTDRIRISRRADGSLDVGNGRHRIEVARELGVRSLPGQIYG
jgi:hypothetical protein